ncbi:MAG: hypothetical protein CL678_00375 [Bdellovibrionaceae bacterium]|nr:hypothetical protein [Pseudobdellovibrionaceae bacterium]
MAIGLGRRRHAHLAAHGEIGALSHLAPVRAPHPAVPHWLAGAREPVAQPAMAAAPLPAAAHTYIGPGAAAGAHHGPLYLDLETTGVEVDAAITCAVIRTADDKVHVWHSGHGHTMTEETGNAVVDFLKHDVVTFNGAAFDLRMLWNLTKRNELKGIALDHRDVLVDFVADNRYYASMDSFATATLRGGKTNSGAWAATAWFNGQAEQVIEYCKEDTAVLKRLVEHVGTYGQLQRMTKANRRTTWVCPAMDGSIRCVRDALANVKPVPQWMSDPPQLPDVEWARS